MRTQKDGVQTAAPVNISALPRVLRISSLVEIALALLFIAYGSLVPRYWLFIVLGALFTADAVRILGWRLETTSESLRVRRYFLWRSIPWTQILKVAVGDTWGRGQKAVRLDLMSQPVMSLGSFPEAFALAVGDALSAENQPPSGQDSFVARK